MDDDVREFGMDLGRKVLARDWPAVHEKLAPWLQRSFDVAAVRTFFEDEYKAAVADSGKEGEHHPEYPEPEVGGNNFMTATELRKPIEFAGGKVRPVAPEVTDEMVRYWMKLQLLCSDDQMEQLGFDFFAEVWMLVVDTPEGLRVGYWSQGAY
jgi:hypothetical protein